MLKRVGTRLGVTLLVIDLALTAVALHLAKLLRLTLPFGIPLDEPLSFGPWFYLLVPAIWALAFLGLRIYDPARALRYLDDVQAMWSAVTWAALVLAGVAYLFFREFSRLLFFYFYMLDLVFLLGWRAILRHLLRLGVGSSLGEPRRVLVVGAGSHRLFAAHQHLVLRGDHLLEIPAHEDDLVVIVRRQIRQQEADDLDHLAATVAEPGVIRGLVELLDPLVLEVALWVIDIGLALAVADAAKPCGIEHLHGHRRAGTGKTGDHHDRLSVPQSTNDLPENRRHGALSNARPSLAKPGAAPYTTPPSTGMGVAPE